MVHSDSAEPARPRVRLTVRVRDTDDRAQVISASGELDMDTGPALEKALTHALHTDPPPRVLAVDFTAMTFCDSTGLNLLLRARTQARQRAIPLHLVGLQPHVLLVFEITGAHTLFAIHDRIEQALQ